MDRIGRIIASDSEEATISYGRELVNFLDLQACICFFGELGAGKTTLIKGIISALTGAAIVEVCSPTYSYLQIFEGECPVYHFDLYRLPNLEAFLDSGMEEYLFAAKGVCCIEWSERIEALLPKRRYHVTITHVDENNREILFESIL